MDYNGHDCENGFGKRLEQAIGSNFYKIGETADLLGINRATLSNYINGHSMPTSETLIRMSRLLKVSTDWLLGIEKIDAGYDKILEWLKINGKNLNEEKQAEIADTLPRYSRERDRELSRIAMNRLKKFLTEHKLNYEMLKPNILRLYYPNSSDYTAVEMHEGQTVSIAGRIIGNLDAAMEYILNEKYYS